MSERTWLNVLGHDLNKFVSVRAGLLVVEAQRMENLMLDHLFVNAPTLLNRDQLIPALATYVGPAPVTHTHTHTHRHTHTHTKADLCELTKEMVEECV